MRPDLDDYHFLPRSGKLNPHLRSLCFLVDCSSFFDSLLLISRSKGFDFVFCNRTFGCLFSTRMRQRIRGEKNSSTALYRNKRLSHSVFENHRLYTPWHHLITITSVSGVALKLVITGCFASTLIIYSKGKTKKLLQVVYMPVYMRLH